MNEFTLPIRIEKQLGQWVHNCVTPLRDSLKLKKTQLRKTHDSTRMFGSTNNLTVVFVKSTIVIHIYIYYRWGDYPRMAWIIQNTCIFQVVIVYQSISYYITWGRTSIRPVELALNLPRHHGCASDWVVCDPDKKSIIESKWGDSIWWDYTYIYIIIYIHMYICE